MTFKKTTTNQIQQVGQTTLCGSYMVVIYLCVRGQLSTKSKGWDQQPNKHVVLRLGRGSTSRASIKLHLWGADTVLLTLLLRTQSMISTIYSLMALFILNLSWGLWGLDDKPTCAARCITVPMPSHIWSCFSLSITDLMIFNCILYMIYTSEQQFFWFMSM